MLAAIERAERGPARLDLAVRVGITTGEAVVRLGPAPADRGRGRGRGQHRLPAGGGGPGRRAWWWGRRPSGPPGGCSTTRSWPRSGSRARPSRCRCGGWRAPAAAPASRPSAGPGTPFVGRRGRAGPAQGPVRAGPVTDRTVRLVTVVGEPGVGKSRLRPRAGRLRRRPARAGHLAPGPLPALWRRDHLLGAGGDRQGPGRHPGVRPTGRGHGQAGRRPWPTCSPTRSERELAAGAAGPAARDRRPRRGQAPSGPSCSPPGGGSSRPSPPPARWSLVVEDLHWADQAMLEFLGAPGRALGRPAPAGRGHGPARAAGAPAGLGRRQTRRRPGSRWGR